MTLSYRTIAKGFFLLVILGFFMPMGCNMNGFQLVNNNMLIPIGVFTVYTIFISAIVGLLIGFLLLINKGVPVIIDWLITVSCFICVMFFYISFVQVQCGTYLILAGSVFNLIFQIISAVKKET